MTRKQLQEDPYWCQVLDNPFLKDQMELAIRFEEAETGDFADKKAFVEFYVCNGPELDADTLLFWRREILLNPTYNRIANTYYSDLPTVRAIREETYGKLSTYWTDSGEERGNCFTNPCDYVGPFSTRICYRGDQAFNTATTDDVMAAERIKVEKAGDATAYPSASPSGKASGGVRYADLDKTSGLGGLIGSLTGNIGAGVGGLTEALFGGSTRDEPVPYATDSTDGTTDRVSGRIPRCYRQTMIPSQQKMYDTWTSHYSDQVASHARNVHAKLWKKGAAT